MNRYVQLLSLATLFFTSISPSSILADVDTEYAAKNQDEERAEKSRALPPNEIKALARRHTAEARHYVKEDKKAKKKAHKAAIKKGTSKSKNSKKEKLIARCCGMMNSDSRQDSIHFLNAIPKNGTLEIENGAVFTIRGNTAHWQTNQAIRIKPNVAYDPLQFIFGKYSYRIHNETLGRSVEAKLTFGPFKNWPTTRRVTWIDPSSQIIILDNNFKYRVPNSNALQKWNVNDFIIVGDYAAEWHEWNCLNTGPNRIVINVTTDSYLSAYSY